MTMQESVGFHDRVDTGMGWIAAHDIVRFVKGGAMTRIRGLTLDLFVEAKDRVETGMVGRTHNLVAIVNRPTFARRPQIARQFILLDIVPDPTGQFLERYHLLVAIPHFALGRYQGRWNQHQKGSGGRKEDKSKTLPEGKGCSRHEDW